VSLGQWNGADAADAAGRIRLGTQADRDGLDLFTVADHPYFGDKLDAYALTGFLLGRTESSHSPACTSAWYSRAGASTRHDLSSPNRARSRRRTPTPGDQFSGPLDSRTGRSMPTVRDEAPFRRQE
jgi:hypothetical protein